ncbi:hypothetical protein SALBM311S_05502 [Streptomyces alboniger]
MHTRTTAFLDMAGAARLFPSWLDSLITGYSTHGVALFAVLMLAGWWQVVRQDAPPQALKALAAPVLTLIAFRGQRWTETSVAGGVCARWWPHESRHRLPPRSHSALTTGPHRPVGIPASASGAGGVMKRSKAVEVAGISGLAAWTVFGLLTMAVIGYGDTPLSVDNGVLNWSVDHRPDADG